MGDLGGTNLFDAGKPMLDALVGLLKLGALYGTPLAILSFIAWFSFVRWSQHGVDL